jgi:hypothetical protein
MLSHPKPATPIVVAARTTPTQTLPQRAPALPVRVLQSSRAPQQLCFQFHR